ncbi:hypothetical protein FNV43_RR16245 [Rhamnella rubrinervis]|uniref:Uncharacterized protein n=1 Tax=Rhamnella rubrinervis TaxID=2594499 RepID=A0A8K0GXF2_9ROSA|nr:hypothetical protein FNV43_RR16245 [Rhamnella rubrinervis]
MREWENTRGILLDSYHDKFSSSPSLALGAHRLLQNPSSTRISSHYDCPFDIDAEVLGWVIGYAEKYAWQKVVWEIDAKEVVKEVMAEKDPMAWSLFENFLPIKSRFVTFDWEIKWSPRLSNAVADAIAKFTSLNSCYISIDKFSLESLPKEILAKLVQDQLDLFLNGEIGLLSQFLNTRHQKRTSISIPT